MALTGASPAPAAAALLTAGGYILGHFVFSTAVPSLFWSSVESLRSGLGPSAKAARATPVVVLILLGLFLTPEFWRFGAPRDGARFVAVAVVIASVLALFAVASLRPIWARLCALDFPPLSGEDPGEHTAPLREATPRPIDRRAARVNVALSLGARLAVRLLVVALMTMLVFVLLGTLGFDDALAADLAGRPASTVVEIGGVRLTGELLEVAAMLGLLGALAFAVDVLTDDRRRAEFFDDEIRRLQDAIVAWSRYVEPARSWGSGDDEPQSRLA